MMLRFLRWLLLASTAASTNFNWEKVQLNRNETLAYPDIDFGNTSGANSTYTGPKCKVGPSDAGWPTADEWTKLNKTLGGALLKPAPPAAVCYQGQNYDAAKCDFITAGSSTTYFADHPVAALTEWAGGNTCPVAKNPAPKTCTQGAFPPYVVNATTVRQIQIAVNFARNRNLRLVIKWVQLSSVNLGVTTNLNALVSGTRAMISTGGQAVLVRSASGRTASKSLNISPNIYLVLIPGALHASAPASNSGIFSTI